jgi:hypothetical protein
MYLKLEVEMLAIVDATIEDGYYIWFGAKNTKKKKKSNENIGSKLD